MNLEEIRIQTLLCVGMFILGFLVGSVMTSRKILNLIRRWNPEDPTH